MSFSWHLSHHWRTLRYGEYAINFAKGCKQLRILEIPKHFVNCSDLTGLQGLEQFSCQISPESIQELLSALPKLTKIKIEFKFDFLTLQNPNEAIGNLLLLFPCFGIHKSLREIQINDDSSCGTLRLTSDCLDHVDSLTLRNVKLTVGDMHVIAKQFVALSRFALLGFEIRFSSEFVEVNFVDYEESDVIVFEFLNAISNLSRLERLFLDHYQYKMRSEPLVGSAKEKLLAFLKKLPKLRRLSCNLFDIEAWFEAWCKMASNNLEHSYAFNDLKDDFHPALSEEVKKSMPRNVYIFTKKQYFLYM